MSEKYVFDKPLLIFSNNISELPNEKWQSAETWIDILGSASPAPIGVILPLELQPTYGSLWGIELLQWLRWSSSEAIRFIPVLTVAWQPLEMILRKKQELLLVSRGVRFARLPEVLQGSPNIMERFVKQVRENPDKFKADLTEVEFLAGGMAGEAVRMTHHDLANEGYSAWRLWEGYLQALRDASADRDATKKSRNVKPSRELFAAVEKVEFPKWMSELKHRMRKPSFQQFQALRRDSTPPQYPQEENALNIVRDHAKDGLPAPLRILLVEDEFEKGLADVLLQMLFGKVVLKKYTPSEFKKAEFTFILPNDSERVYCESADPLAEKKHWARFVCVRDTESAAHWLRLWKEVSGDEDVIPAEANNTYRDWLCRWANHLELKTLPVDEVKDLEFKLTGNNAPYNTLDLKSARPANVTTVILLDLRLNRDEPETSYSPEDFASLRFRKVVKKKRSDIPVVILTASRQALNYAAASSGAGEQDGWLTKEAPDVPVDDNNSSRAVHYLLKKLNVFSTLGEWHRPALEWETDTISEFSSFWMSSEREKFLHNITAMSTKLFQDIKAGTQPSVPLGVRFYGYIKSQIADKPYPIMSVLAGRMVMTALFLYSSKCPTNEMPQWDLEALEKILPDSPSGRQLDEPFNKRLSVILNRDLALPGIKFGINTVFSALLPLEYEWLLKQDYGSNTENCQHFIKIYHDTALSRK